MIHNFSEIIQYSWHSWEWFIFMQTQFASYFRLLWVLCETRIYWRGWRGRIKIFPGKSKVRTWNASEKLFFFIVKRVVIAYSKRCSRFLNNFIVSWTLLSGLPIYTTLLCFAHKRISPRVIALTHGLSTKLLFRAKILITSILPFI